MAATSTMIGEGRVPRGRPDLELRDSRRPRRRHRWRPVVGAGIIALLALTGCGGDDDGSDEGSSGQSTSSAEEGGAETSESAPSTDAAAAWPEQDPTLIEICRASRQAPPTEFPEAVPAELKTDAEAYVAMWEAALQGGDAPDPTMSPALQALVDEGCIAASYPAVLTDPWFTLLRIEGTTSPVTVVILGECPDGTVPTDVTVFGEPVEEVAPGEYAVESDIGDLPLTPEDVAIPAKGLIRTGSTLDAIVSSGGKGPEMFTGMCPGS